MYQSGKKRECSIRHDVSAVIRHTACLPSLGGLGSEASRCCPQEGGPRDVCRPPSSLLVATWKGMLREHPLLLGAQSFLAAMEVTARQAHPGQPSLGPNNHMQGWILPSGAKTQGGRCSTTSIPVVKRNPSQKVSPLPFLPWSPTEGEAMQTCSSQSPQPPAPGEWHHLRCPAGH